MSTLRPRHTGRLEYRAELLRQVVTAVMLLAAVTASWAATVLLVWAVWTVTS